MTNEHKHPKQIAAAIVTYNADMSRLRDNIKAVIMQVDCILIVDNNSSNIEEIKSIQPTFSNLHLICNTENRGIAAALNQAAEWALYQKIQWLITLDQDSVVPDNLVSEYRSYTEDENIGMICCPILDRNMGVLTRKPITNPTDYVEACITSASMIRLSSWKDVGGFCEDFFIDAVDFDFCYCLTASGYKILRVNTTQLLHEVGHGKIVNILGRKELVFNHSPIRCYYMIRNTLRLGQRHKRNFYFTLIVIKRILLVLCFETNRLEKAKAMTRGIFDACIRKHFGKY